MLSELYIKNFALIDELYLELGDGLNVITGETGAGKSIILGALAAAVGEKTDPQVIRKGTDKATVEAVFDLSDSPDTREKLSELGMDCEDGMLVLTREIHSSGRSTSRVNRHTVGANVIKDIAAHLIDFHGQRDHGAVLAKSAHMNIFDNYCGEEVLSLKSEVAALHGELAELEAKYEAIMKEGEQNARLLEMYRFEAEDIKKADLREDEEEELGLERNRLANAEKLYEYAAEIANRLSGEENSAREMLGAASAAAERLVAADPTAEEAANEVRSAEAACEEASVLIRNYLDTVDIDPGRLEEVEARLDTISRMKRKYEKSVAEIIAYGDELEEKIRILSGTEENGTGLLKTINDKTAELKGLCARLTELRKSNAEKFEKAIEGELRDLAMPSARFEVSIEPTEPKATGADDIEFMISPNAGEDLKPLIKTASGGEISRIMLAIKTIARCSIPTLVFDEIDSGIGGLTAGVFASKISDSVSKAQIICITHLAQVACHAGRHFSVTKFEDEGNTHVHVRVLETDEDKAAELTRMLGSKMSSTTAVEHAREMLKNANR